jgi:hypothetical protein
MQNVIQPTSPTGYISSVCASHSPDSKIRPVLFLRLWNQTANSAKPFWRINIEQMDGVKPLVINFRKPRNTRAQARHTRLFYGL